jgi:hypothetical protein
LCARPSSLRLIIKTMQYLNPLAHQISTAKILGAAGLTKFLLQDKKGLKRCSR